MVVGLLAAAGAGLGQCRPYCSPVIRPVVVSPVVRVTQVTVVVKPSPADIMAAQNLALLQAATKELSKSSDEVVNQGLSHQLPHFRYAAAKEAAKRKGVGADALMPLIGDPDGYVRQSARESLKAKTGKDFGPLPLASAEQAVDAKAKWKE